MITSWTLFSFAQANADSNAAKDNFYSKALFASLAKMEEAWGHISRNTIDYHDMIVVAYPQITDTLPLQFGDYRVRYLDNNDLIATYKKFKREFPVFIAHPMVNEGDFIKVSFTVNWVSYKKRRLNFGVSDWSNVYFRYDCEKREYVIDKVELGGI